MSKPKHGDVVEVEWNDSEGIDLGWKSVKEYLKAADHPHAYRTAGYWIEGSQKGRVVMGLSIDPFNRAMTGCISIPAQAITKTTVLGRSNGRVRKALR